MTLIGALDVFQTVFQECAGILSSTMEKLLARLQEEEGGRIYLKEAWKCHVNTILLARKTKYLNF